MSETKPAPREHGDHRLETVRLLSVPEQRRLIREDPEFFENVKFVTEPDSESVPMPPCWKTLCERPDVVRRELCSSPERLQVSDDMTRSFDTLGGEVSPVIVPILMAVDSAVGEVPNPPPGQPGGDSGVSSAPTKPDRDRLDCRVDTYRRWSRVFRQLGGDGWLEVDFGHLWDTALADLTERMWLTRVVNPRSHLASIGMQALHCVHHYVTLLMISVAVRKEDLVERAALRLERLWKRVRHLLETGEDDPSLAGWKCPSL